MTEPESDATKEQWAAMSARQRGALIRAVRRGEQVAEPDRPVAAAVARRELTRLTSVRPGRVRLVRLVHAGIALCMAVLTAAHVSAGKWGGVVIYGGLAVVFGTAALLAPRRLAHEIGRAAQALERNS